MTILRLSGSTSGYTQLSAPAAAGNNTLVLPTGNGSSGQALTTDGTGTLSWSNNGLTVGTAQASTSGTVIDFAGLPSWAKRITVMFDRISASGTSQFLVRLGTSGGFATTGYSSYASTTNGSITTSTAGLLAAASGVGAGNTFLGQMTIASFGGTAWSASGILVQSATNGGVVGGYVDIGSALTRLRVTTVNGTDTFDAGSINIMYEG